MYLPGNMDARQAVGLSGELVGCSGDVGVLPGCNRTQDRTMLLSFSINQNHPQRLVGDNLPSALNSDLAGLKDG